MLEVLEKVIGPNVRSQPFWSAVGKCLVFPAMVDAESVLLRAGLGRPIGDLEHTLRVEHRRA